MSKTSGPYTWAGRPIVHPDDINDLDRTAAVAEFHDKNPRDIAEDLAYRKYQKDQHVAAAAHHWAGGQAARGSGDTDAARKHARLYEMHIKALGHDPFSEVPPEVRAHHAKRLETGEIDSFEPHKADALLLDGSKPVA